jgi:hypothetical protein
MIPNYLKTIFRQLSRNWAYTIINQYLIANTQSIHGLCQWLSIEEARLLMPDDLDDHRLYWV